MQKLDAFSQKRLRRYYNLLRAQAEKDHAAWLEETYQKWPELKKLESARIDLSLALIKSQMGQGSGEESELRRELADLDHKLADFLQARGLPANYDQVTYHCPICRDTGWAGSDYCQCINRALLNLNKTDQEFYPPQDKTFANFRLEIFSPDLDEKYFNGKMSPRDAIKGIRAWSLRYLENFPQRKGNSYFFGRPGTGKTYMMTAMANSLLDQGYNVVYIRAVQLFEIMAQRRILLASFNPDPVEQDRIKRQLDLVHYADLLCIDDLGLDTGVFNNAAADFILLLDQRQDQGLPVIITSNIRPRDLGDEYDPRLQSRITGNYELTLFEGEDVRKRIARAKSEINIRETKRELANGD